MIEVLGKVDWLANELLGMVSSKSREIWAFLHDGHAVVTGVKGGKSKDGWVKGYLKVR